VTRGRLPQRAGSLGLNGGGAAAAVPPVAVWNNLENGVIKFSSLECFKNTLLIDCCAICPNMLFLNYPVGLQMYSQLF